MVLKVCSQDQQWQPGELVGNTESQSPSCPSEPNSGVGPAGCMLIRLPGDPDIHKLENLFYSISLQLRTGQPLLAALGSKADILLLTADI